VLLMDLVHGHHSSLLAQGAAAAGGSRWCSWRTKRGADALEDWLCRNGYMATTIHGDRTQGVSGYT